VPAPPAQGGARDLSQRGSGAGARPHARRADLPGAGDAARNGRRRLYPWRSGPPAPLDGGMEEAWRTGALRGQAERRNDAPWLQRAVRRGALPADPRLRRIRLPRIACRELRAAGLRLLVAQVPPP